VGEIPLATKGRSGTSRERKKTEEALRQSEEKYRNILESIEEGYYEVDLTGNFTFSTLQRAESTGTPKRNSWA